MDARKIEIVLKYKNSSEKTLTGNGAFCYIENQADLDKWFRCHSITPSTVRTTLNELPLVKLSERLKQNMSKEARSIDLKVCGCVRVCVCVWGGCSLSDIFVSNPPPNKPAGINNERGVVLHTILKYSCKFSGRKAIAYLWHFKHNRFTNIFNVPTTRSVKYCS